MRFCRILIIVVPALFYFQVSRAQNDSTILNKLRIAGYFENQLQGQSQSGNYFLTDYNKLRLNLTASIDSNISFYSNINFRTYHGKTELNILQYLPPTVVQEYLSQVGLPSEEVTPLFINPLKNDFLFDNAYITIYSENVVIRIGKQQLPWGTGYVWNPTMVFHTRNMLDPTYELTGVNAMKFEYLLTDQSSLTFIYSASDKIDNSTYALKAKTYTHGFDISGSYVYFQYASTDFYTFTEIQESKHQIGADFSGSIGGFGVYGEGAFRLNASKSNDAEYLSGLLGLNYYFPDGLYVMGEYYYNGKGKSNLSKYDINDWMNYLGPYAESLGKHYLFSGIRFPIGNYLNFSIFGMFNLSDQSYIYYPRLEYSLGNNAELIGQIYFPDGASTNAEFGTSGIGGMARIRIYF